MGERLVQRKLFFHISSLAQSHRLLLNDISPVERVDPFGGLDAPKGKNIFPHYSFQRASGHLGEPGVHFSNLCPTHPTKSGATLSTKPCCEMSCC